MDNNYNYTSKDRRTTKYLDENLRLQILKNYNRNHITPRNIYLRPKTIDRSIVLNDFMLNKKNSKFSSNTDTIHNDTSKDTSQQVIVKQKYSLVIALKKMIFFICCYKKDIK